ncbi:succinate dehydrogenase / fumarate reductase membrane anchor subunit [Thalassospira sp. MBR-102]|jgi:succinate dehydrogenase / fumarate reductase membrane anchor subunit|uniref:Succinate dehydrogenase hydrophobic membrane anchor subunit n=3 Tax=Thalassospira TaxID=168934 RepID=A0ABR5Y852_9PROT|nr:MULTISPECIES: succinate dehydrogenase, hydrophobic membrane anchor protein [Thalassospira]MBR9780354.1 succinate dehydrogenase, hydrophobic membrane anchor protein [Rhodospirillales bacterium]AJD53789.1 succinate dehydrogenase, hydrophobic membrane anchor protein [Thalassospira xiamenensis M-5 = DSM 17429]KZD06511.1 succinate dehydrogenase [Thalassospira xiamenensis]KZD10895.1 succinate dehydrogenase [Thalassospira xiamenensis]MAB33859.1 succinate dehydrogenase, hydrophobic membrane anchor |tara:strand:+ start:936 stop:1319 length:384 start_codon:yes stop_codon:yes gene_type:complete
MKMQSDLGRVRGLGSAKSGSSHWWTQRVTAVANLPLGIWFIISILSGHTADYDAVRDWLSSYFHSTMMILMIISVSVHFTHGLQVVIEDYVHNRKAEIVSLFLIKAVAAFLSVAAIVSVMRIVFAGA